MQVKLSKKGTTLIAGIIGELDHHSAEYIRQKIDNEMTKATTRNIIFDFTKLGFMDSSGIGVLMGRYRIIQKMGGRAVIVNADVQIQRILEMSGILKIIPVYTSVDAAVDELQSTG